MFWFQNRWPQNESRNGQKNPKQKKNPQIWQFNLFLFLGILSCPQRVKRHISLEEQVFPSFLLPHCTASKWLCASKLDEIGSVFSFILAKAWNVTPKILLLPFLGYASFPCLPWVQPPFPPSQKTNSADSPNLLQHHRGAATRKAAEISVLIWGWGVFPRSRGGCSSSSEAPNQPRERKPRLVPSLFPSPAFVWACLV